MALVIAGCGGASPQAAPAPAAPPTVVDAAACRPPKAHPSPVVLVPGTFAATSWAVIGPALARRGYCVFTFHDDGDGTGDIVASARALDAFVERVRARTGARRVAIVGHSQGGMMPRYYIRFEGGAAKVDELVGLAPSNHGTSNLLALGGAFLGCRACEQQLAWGSRLLTELNAGQETPAPVDYTVVQTRYDAVVVPYTSAFLDGPARRVTNVLLQTRCPSDVSGHLGIATDPVAVQWVEHALGRRGPADPAFRPACGPWW